MPGFVTWPERIGHFALASSDNLPEGEPAGIRVIAEGRPVKDWELASQHATDSSLDFEATSKSTGLVHRSTWKLNGHNVWTREDRLVNAGTKAIALREILPRLIVPEAEHEIYFQSSRWIHESQGEWQTLRHWNLEMGHERGRTTDGGVPALWLRPEGRSRGLALHLLPVGNWTLRVRRFEHHVALDAGPSNRELNAILKPGETFRLPEIAYLDFLGEPGESAARIQKWFLQRYPTRPAPAIYNSWFTHFDDVSREKLLPQIRAAKELGCEVFVHDAGWFGAKNDWWGQAGDWSDGPEGAYGGKLALFADEVRALGMGFGIWMEPERFAPKAPLRKDKPAWFPNNDDFNARIDLENPEAHAWLDAEIRRVITTYKIAFMKLDFNFQLGLDHRGGELQGYMDAWYRLVAGLRKDFPEVYFEGCASGAMRCELRSMAAYDGFFLSDTVNPWDCLSIFSGSILRAPGTRFTRWPVIREREGRAECCQGAGWDGYESVDPDFLCAVSFPGQFGLSGDLASLHESAPAVRKWVSLAKAHRERVSRCAVRPLSPPRRLGDRSGWDAYLLEDPRGGGYLCAYRLNDPASNRRFPVEAKLAKRLDREGEAVLRDGELEVRIDGRHRAAIFAWEA